MRTLLLAVLSVSLAVPLSAQIVTPAPPISVDVLVIPATGDPVTVAALGVRNTPISLTSAVCNQLATAAAPVPLINPTTVEFDDPFTAGRECRALIPIGLPNGLGYRAVAVFKHAAGTPDSARSLVGVPFFDIAGTLVPHAAPTGLAVKP